MNLKNYTSTVPAMTSIARIEKMLVEIGAKNINKQYDNGNPVPMSVIFLIEMQGQTIPFKVPAKVDVVHKVLWEQVKRPQTGTEKKIQEQAERTAWKIVHDWVEIQCAMIMLQQAEIVEVFLPYVYHLESQTTFFQQLKESNFKALNPG